MRINYKAITAIILLVFILIWMMRQGEWKSGEEPSPFSLEMSDLRLVNRLGGKKVWELTAKEVTASPDQNVKILHGIEYGLLYAGPYSGAVFNAPEAIYYEQTGDLAFRQGVTLNTVQGMQVFAGKMHCEGKSGLLKAEGPIELLWGDYSIRGSEMLGEYGGEKVTLGGFVTLKTRSGLSVRAEKLIYEGSVRKMTLSGNVYWELKQSEHPLVRGRARAVELLAERRQMVAIGVIAESEDCILEADEVIYNENEFVLRFLHQVAVRFEGYRVTSSQAVFDRRRRQILCARSSGTGPAGESFFAASTTLDIQTGDLEILQGELRLSPGESVLAFAHNREMIKLTAERIWASGDKTKYRVTANFAKIENKQGDVLEANQATWLGKEKRIHLRSGVTYRRGELYQVEAEHANYDWEKEFLSTSGNLRFTHKNGTVVSGDQAEINCRQRTVRLMGIVRLVDSNSIIVEGKELLFSEETRIAEVNNGVRTQYPGGRWLTADRMVLNTDSGESDFTGNIRAGLEKR